MATKRHRKLPTVSGATPAAPCGTCPYRRSTPLGVWGKVEYDKLRKQESIDPCEVVRQLPPGTEISLKDLFGSVYGCHLEDGHVCRGWLADQKRRDLPSITLRMRLRVDPDLVKTLKKVNEKDPDLYDSVEEMCAANEGVEFPFEDPKAKKLIRVKLLKTKEKRTSKKSSRTPKERKQSKGRKQ